MDKWTELKGNRGFAAKAVLAAMAAAWGITAAALLILSGLLFWQELSVHAVEGGILIIYTLGALTAGAVAGRQMFPAGYGPGFLAGGMYYVLLLTGSLLLRKTLAKGAASLLTLFVICTAAGMLGALSSHCLLRKKM